MGQDVDEGNRVFLGICSAMDLTMTPDEKPCSVARFHSTHFNYTNSRLAACAGHQTQKGRLFCCLHTASCPCPGHMEAEDNKYHPTTSLRP